MSDCIKCLVFCKGALIAEFIMSTIDTSSELTLRGIYSFDRVVLQRIRKDSDAAL